MIFSIFNPFNSSLFYIVLINFTRIFVEKCRGSTNRPRAIEIRMIIGTERRMRLVGFLSKYTDHQIHILYLCVFEDTDHPEIFIERLDS